MSLELKKPESSEPITFDRLIEMTKEVKVVGDGPLGRLYTDTLNQMYAKDVDPATGIALETQAMDSVTAKNLWLAAQSASNNFQDQGTEVGMVYGVYRHQTTVADVINVADSFSEMSAAQKKNSCIIIDTMEVPDPSGNLPVIKYDQVINPFAAALEQLAVRHGVPVHVSLEAYVKSFEG